MKIKLFYSYSHKDENHKKELETHLKILRDKQLIDEWHDRKINAGDEWDKEIENNMEDAHIILLLFSPDFIASSACKKEIDKAVRLKQEKGTIFIPIILRTCSWQELTDIAKIQALPQDGKSITECENKDAAWHDVYNGIKKQVETIRNNITPTLKEEFKNELLNNPVSDCALDRLFVYPDILEVSQSKKKLENNEIDSSKLCDIESFQHSYILIEGEEQSGKTSLCNMLYLNYIDKGFYPILINGKNITGKANIEDIVTNKYEEQYNSTQRYWQLDKTKKILIIDDINNKKANDENYALFLQKIKNNFEYAIILIDALHNLADRSGKHNYFYPFNDYSIKSFGYKKRDELIKKCIANDENSEFDINNSQHIARLDKDTAHINTIVGANISPSSPFFIISSFNIIESLNFQDRTKTSYGYCYQAMITIKLHRANIKAGSMNEYFNFLEVLAYFMFNKKIKEISIDDLDNVLRMYEDSYMLYDKNITNKLVEANILVTKNSMYSFQYIYIYYYFVAQYIANNFTSSQVKKQLEDLISTIHKKDNSNIVIFITHHANKENLNVLLNNLMKSAKSTFKNFPEATLYKEEVAFLLEAIKKIKVEMPSEGHDIEQQRSKQLKQQDDLQKMTDKEEKEIENNGDNLDSLSIEILKSAKNMEIIGQILKNQYGTFEKDKLKKLFQEGQNVGLRLLQSFIHLMSHYPDLLNNLIEDRLIEIQSSSNVQLSEQEIERIKKWARQFSYNVVFGWLHKIVESLGYEKLVAISDDVDSKVNTPASKLINFSIHAWHKKDLDTDRLKLLSREFDKDNQPVAYHILKDIVARHLYMHKVDYKKKQQIHSLLGFSVSEQISAQKKIK